MSEYLNDIGNKAREASRILGILTDKERSDAIIQIANQIEVFKDEIIEANKIDIENLIKKAEKLNMKDRLELNERRIVDMAEGARQVAEMPDPVDGIIESFERPNGMKVSKISVPFGVIGIIYESRPNVTVDAALLCLKAGNAVVLRGGSEALSSNKALVNIIAKALKSLGLPETSVQLITQTDRETAAGFMKLNKYIDVLIPRGGAGLISAVVENATIPVIETGTGICHVYIDEEADFTMADNIVINAKTQRPSVCNAIESLLVNRNIATKYLPGIIEDLIERGVEIRANDDVTAFLKEDLNNRIKQADENDWDTEYNDLILSIKTVENANEAIEHINRHGTGHSECIVTENEETAGIFQKKIDAACVYWNVSTRFTDGFEFGFGAEIGISNQKLHARGPMGLRELTTYKYIITGNGQIR